MTSCGSPNYASPEVIQGLPYDGTGADVWSCGVILFAMLTRKLPFESENLPVLFEQIRTGAYSIPDYVSEKPKDLIRRMLSIDP